MRLTAMIPAHNAAATIEAAILSVLNQTFTDFELWVLENGSSDETLHIAKKFASDRVKVFDLGPIGFQAALEWGIREANTPYIARMDADDICLPHRFEEQIKVLESNPNFVLCGSEVMLLTPFNHIIEVKTRGRRSGEVGFMHMSDIPGREKRFFGDPTVIFRRDVALEVGLYDARFPVGDVSLWIRMLQHHKGYQLANPSLLYRLVPRSMSNTLVFNQKTLACRLEYYGNMYPNAEQILNLPKEEVPENGPRSFWIRNSMFELLSGNKAAYVESLRQAGIGIGLSVRVKLAFLFFYRLYHRLRFGVTYIPRKDLEKQFLGSV